MEAKRYRERYYQFKKMERDFVDTMYGEIVNLFKTVWLKPIRMGNRIYYYCDYKGKEVPAYFDELDNDFRPIYDEDGEKLFGWADIENVVKIFDALRDKFERETSTK